MASGPFLERPFWDFEVPIRIPYKPLDILSQHLKPPQGPTRIPLEPHWNPTTFIRSCSHYLETILLGLKIPNLFTLLIHTQCHAQVWVAAANDIVLVLFEIPLPNPHSTPIKSWGPWYAATLAPGRCANDQFQKKNLQRTKRASAA